MIATIQLPIWSPAVAFLVICWAIDLASTRRKRRTGEARRLRALNELWADGDTFYDRRHDGRSNETDPSSALHDGVRGNDPVEDPHRDRADARVQSGLGRRVAVAAGASASARRAPLVDLSPRPAATDAGGLGDAAA